MFLHTYHPSPLLVAFGPVAVHWYGLLLVVGGCAAYWVTRQLFQRSKISATLLDDLLVPLVLAGFLGARLYHVLNEWSYYAAHPFAIFAVWRGGLAIHGALLAGVIVIWFFARKHSRLLCGLMDGRQRESHKSHTNSNIHDTNTKIVSCFLFLADLFAPGIALAQAIGRWGNYFNQELYGRPTDAPWGIPIDAARRVSGYEAFPYFHPTFLYESVWLFITFIILFFILRYFLKKSQRMPVGIIFFLYFILAGLGRCFTETLRIDEMPLAWGIRLQLLVSIGMMIIGMAGLIWRTCCHFRENGYNERCV